MMVSRLAHGLPVARDGPRYTNIYETRNEATIPARTLLLATLVAFLGDAAAASSLGGGRLLPRIKSLTLVQVPDNRCSMRTAGHR